MTQELTEFLMKDAEAFFLFLCWLKVTNAQCIHYASQQLTGFTWVFRGETKQRLFLFVYYDKNICILIESKIIGENITL